MWGFLLPRHVSNWVVWASEMGRVEVEISAEEALFGIHEERGGLKGVRAFFFLLSSLQKKPFRAHFEFLTFLTLIKK